MSNLKRLLTSAIVAGSVIGGVTFATASSAAADTPVGGCQPGRVLAPTTEVQSALDNGNTHDQNGDGWLCGRENNGQSNKNNALSVTWNDNNRRLPTPTPPAGQTVCESFGGDFATGAGGSGIVWVCNGLPTLLPITDRPFNLRFNALNIACDEDGGGALSQQPTAPQNAACFF